MDPAGACANLMDPLEPAGKKVTVAGEGGRKDQCSDFPPLAEVTLDGSLFRNPPFSSGRIVGPKIPLFVNVGASLFILKKPPYVEGVRAENPPKL